MKKEIKRSTLVCTIDESVTAAKLSNDIAYAVKRAQMDNPELTPDDIHMTTEHRDNQLLLYAEWTSLEKDFEEKLRTKEEQIESEIREALARRQTEVIFDCDYTSEKSAAVTHVITRMYHSEPGRIISGAPIFDTHGERQIGIKVTIHYLNE